MRWFKHMTETRSDEKIAQFVEKRGTAGYGLWWIVLETVARQVKNDGEKCSVCYPAAWWAKQLLTTPPNARRKLAALGAAGLLEMSCTPAGISVSVPKLLRYRDEYTRKIMKKSGHSPDQEQIQKTDTDTEGEKTKEAAARPVIDHPPPHVSRQGIELPEWVPPKEWAEYLEMRVCIRRKATQPAQKKILKKLDRLRQQGHTPLEVLNQSIENSWQGVFPISNRNGRAHVSREQQKVANTIAAYERTVEKIEARARARKANSAGVDNTGGVEGNRAE